MKLRLVSLMKCQIIILLIIEALISILHIPSAIRYVLDANMLLMLFFYFSKMKRVKVGRIQKVEIYIFGYVGLLLLVSLLRFVPFGQVLWAVRNNFFFLFFFIMCIAKFTIEDVDAIIGLTIKLQLFNLICGLYEFFVLNLRNDYLGGMFGCEQGCNAYSNIYLLIICTYVITLYMLKKCELSKVLWVVISSVVLATLGELKIFYVELAIVVLCEVLLNKKSMKTVFVVLGSVCAIFIGIQILSTTSSDSLKYFKSIESLLEYGSRIDFGNGDIRISRLTAIAQINEYFFHDSVSYKVFGFGFGACEESTTFAWCNSEFATQYGYLQYRNLSSSMLYLETGILGLIATIGIFVIIFVFATKNKKLLSDHNYEHIAVFGQIMSIMSVFTIWYNSAIRREIAYLLFFSLALVFVYTKRLKTQFGNMTNEKRGK